MADTVTALSEQPLDKEEVSILCEAWSFRAGDAMLGLEPGMIEVWSAEYMREASPNSPPRDEIAAARRLQAKGLGELLEDGRANDGHRFQANDAGLLRGSKEWEHQLDWMRG